MWPCLSTVFIDSNMMSSWRVALDAVSSPLKMSIIATVLERTTGQRIWRCLPNLNMLDSITGTGTALKPACELIMLGRKPLSEGNVAANVARWQCGAVNIDACRVDCDTEQLGRWPSNVLHDGSAEVVSLFPDAPGAQREVNESFAPKSDDAIYGPYGPRPKAIPRGDTGSAARFFNRIGEASGDRRYTKDGSTDFAMLPGMRRAPEPPSRLFYTSKADADSRVGSSHPTIKPLDLMQWLIRLVCVKGGAVLDPFAGTGTTGEATWREGCTCTLIERESEYCADIARRMELAPCGPIARMNEIGKLRRDYDPGPLFGGKS